VFEPMPFHAGFVVGKVALVFYLSRVYIGIVNGLVTCTTNLQDSY